MEENKEVAEEVTQDPVEETTEQESPISYNEDGDIKIDMSKIPAEEPVEEVTIES